MSKVTLAVSLYGPFVFDFEPAAVTVFAPNCEGHFASAQTDTEEVGLAVDSAKTTYQYKLQEGQSSSRGRETLIHAYNPDEILIVDGARRKAKAPGPSDCRFKMQLPRPNQVVPLVADPISILEYDLAEPGNGEFARKATAMRFNYERDESSKPFDLLEVSGSPSSVLSISLKPVPPADYVQLVFRYGSGAPDDGHKDAEHCFYEMRNLFPPLGAWRVRFKEELLLNHLNDCHAPQIVFLTRAEMKAWKSGSKA